MDFDNGVGDVLDQFGDMDGTVFKRSWISTEEEEQLGAWRQRLQLLFPVYVAMWSSLHVGSVLFARVFCDPKSSMGDKDKFLWHNKCAPHNHSAIWSCYAARVVTLSSIVWHDCCHLNSGI